MGGSYFAKGGVEHARTMLRYSEDQRKFGTVTVVVFGIVFGYGVVSFMVTGHGAYLFTTGFGALMLAVGSHLRVHHGKQIAYWTGRLNSWEALRRDRAVHARRLEPWEL